MNTENLYDYLTLNEQLMKKELEEGTPIFLNVYHLSPANYVIQIVGFGFFHTTLEINEIEYSFGATKANISGIFYNKVGEAPKSIRLKEKIHLGNTIYNEAIINRFLQLHLPYWQGHSYDPLLKNCNHFTKFFASKLIKAQKLHYPEYVNRIIDYGIWLNAFYSPIKRLYGSLACQTDDYARIANQNQIDNNELNANENNNNHNVFIDVHIDNMDNININNNQPLDVPTCLQSPSLNHNNNNNHNDQSSNHNHNNSNEDLIHNNFPFDQDEFFEQSFKANQFLKKYQSTEENNSTLNYLSIADDLFFNKNQAEKALTIYQRLLNDIDNETDDELVIFKKNFQIKHYTIEQSHSISIDKDQAKSETEDLAEKDKSNVSILIKVKILHCILYHFYKEEQLQKQESLCNLIMSMNKKDYYAMFISAYIKYKENKYPECFQLLHSCLLDCSNESFKPYLKHFLYIIDTIEMN